MANLAAGVMNYLHFYAGDQTVMRVCSEGFIIFSSKKSVLIFFLAPLAISAL